MSDLTARAREHAGGNCRGCPWEADLLNDLAAALDAKDAEIQRLREAIMRYDDAMWRADRLIESAPCADRCAWTTSGGECDCYRSRARAALSRSDTPGGN